MKKLLLFALFLSSTRAEATVYAEDWTPGPSVLPLPYRCERWDHTPCSDADLARADTRHIVILPAGYSASEEASFWTAYVRTIDVMTNTGDIWSTQKREQLLFIGWFDAGGPIGSSTAQFDAKAPPHLARGVGLSLANDKVYAKVNAIAGTFSHLRPMGALIIFNYEGPVTASASPPNFIDRPYGIAKMTALDLDRRGHYIPAHELGHAALSFLDEYIEAGFENINIHALNALTPLISFDATWTGLGHGLRDVVGYYDMRFAEILAGNGNDNIATTRYPATVGRSEDYATQGGMLFGKGTYHMSGDNLMWGGDTMHTPSQQRVIEEAFGAPATRPNDRLRNAGPTDWPVTLGNTTKVMVSDGDKRHHYHPTRSYTVQVAWQERVWKTCWKVVVPYPCYSDVWRYAEKTVSSSVRRIEVKLTAAWGIASLMQRIVCSVADVNVKTTGGEMRFCDTDLTTTADQLLPSLVYALPFQEISVPASQWFTKYHWRFRTDNGRFLSGYTGWSSFYRTL